MRDISFKKVFQSMLIVIFIIVLIVQLYMLVLVDAVIENANNDYVTGVITGVDYELNQRIDMATRFLKSIAENRNMQIYLSETNESKRKLAYKEVFNEIWKTTRFFDESFYVMAWDSVSTQSTIGNSPSESMVQSIQSFYEKYTRNALSNDLGVFVENGTIVVCKFQDSNMINLQGVGAETVGTIGVIETINIFELKRRLNILDDVSLEMNDSQNDKTYSLFVPSEKKDNWSINKAKISETSLELICGISSSRIPQEYDGIRILTIIIVLLQLFSLIAFLIIFRSLFVKPINKVFGYLDDYASKRKKLFEKVGVCEIDMLAEHINDMIVKLEDNTVKIIQTQEELFEKELEEKNARLYMYQMQIQPHFLYNTLGAISSFAIDYKADEIITIASAMADIFRYSSEEDEMAEFCLELECVQKYVRIMQLRYPERIKIFMDIEDRLFDMKVPKMILQPIVENALKHGILPKQTGGAIYIEGTVENENICIIVRDDGVGMNEEKLDDIRKSLDNNVKTNRQNGRIGIANVYKRILLRYGVPYGLEIKSEENKYTSVKILLPKNERKDDENG